MVPDSVGIGPSPNTTAPATSPLTIVTATSTPSSVIADAYFDSTSRERRDRPQQQVAQRAALRLARDRVAGEQPGRERQEERLHDRERP